MDVQSGSRSSESDRPSSAIDSSANHRDALQDNSSALKEQNNRVTPDNQGRPDTATPDLNREAIPPLERPKATEPVPDETDRLDRKDLPPLDQPDENLPDDKGQFDDQNSDEPIHTKDADATLRPVEPLTPDQPVP